MLPPTPFPYRAYRLATVVVTLALVAAACSSSTTPSPSPSSRAPASAASGIPGASASGTPTPVPPTPITSVAGPTERPLPVATPGATLTAGLARVRGRVTDATTGQPVPGVCVIIGPGSCQPVQPRTDANGVFLVDLPIGSGGLAWDFTFDVGGYRPDTRRISTASGGEQTLEVKLTATADFEPPSGGRD